MPDNLMNTIVRKPVTVANASGSYVFDIAGVDYIDLFGDVGTVSLGHWSNEHLRIWEKMRDELIPIHSPNLLEHPWRQDLARAWCERTKMDKAFFSMSGSEAVEVAIKIARKVEDNPARRGERGLIWAERGGFHGRTYAAMSASDSAPYHKDGFDPLVPGFRFFDHPDEIESQDADLPCAIIVSPIFGNNDVRLYDEGWWRALMMAKEATGFTLIFDEVQTGAGRVGDWTYATRFGLMPDIICMGKGVAMGVPMGMTLARGPAARALTPGTHFSTFGGAPMGCLFGLEMIGWLDKAFHPLNKISALEAILRNLIGARPWLSNVRGLGALLAADVDVPARAFADAALAYGVILGAFRDNAIKITPALNIDTADLVEAFDRLDLAHADVLAKAKAKQP